MQEWLKDTAQNIVDQVFKIIPRKQPSLNQLNNLKIVAHRGWHVDGIKENTLEAFQKCIDHHLWAIEFDIRWTKDLVPIVHHDASTKRVFEKDCIIADITFEELRKDFPLIPSFQEVLDLYSKKIHFFIELKDETFPELEKQKNILKQMLAHLEAEQDYHLITVTPSVLDKFDITSNTAQLLVGEFNLDDLSQIAVAKNYAGVAGHYLLMKQSFIEKHPKIGVGYIRSKNSLYRELNRGVEWIFTNHPNELLKDLKKDEL